MDIKKEIELLSSQLAKRYEVDKDQLILIALHNLVNTEIKHAEEVYEQMPLSQTN